MKLQRSLNSREFREVRSTGRAPKPASGGAKMRALPVRQQVLSNNFL